MKTSNKLLLSALIIFVISLGIYNTALKAEYLTGNYKDPFKDFNTLKFSDFDEIQINAANEIDVNITQGPNKVRVSKRAGSNIKITQQGRKLVLDVVYEKNKASHRGEEVLITCPNLKAISAFGWYTEGGKKITNNNSKFGNWDQQPIVIHGFKTDSLNIEQDNYTYLSLSHNTIGFLKANVGNTATATPILQIQNNIIQKAELNMKQKSELRLNNLYIPQLTYHLGDSTKVSFSGVALKNLKK